MNEIKTARQVIARVRKCGGELRLDPSAPSGFVLRGASRVPNELTAGLRAQAACVRTELWYDEQDARFEVRLRELSAEAAAHRSPRSA